MQLGVEHKTDPKGAEDSYLPREASTKLHWFS